VRTKLIAFVAYGARDIKTKHQDEGEKKKRDNLTVISKYLKVFRQQASFKIFAVAINYKACFNSAIYPV
jgi:hypothetical protein